MRPALLLAPVIGLVAACALVACGGARSGASAAFPSGYEGWRRLNDRPILKLERTELVNLYASPQAYVAGGRLAPGSILVKEQRHLMGSEARPQAGKAFLIAVMIKQEDGGWTYGAFDPDSGEPATNVDTDGCALCHASRRETDSTYRAYGDLL